MPVVGSHDAALVGESLVQLVEVDELVALGKEASPDKPHLSFNLPRLLSAGGRAGHRLEQVVGGQVLEPAIEDLIPAREHFAFDRLQIVSMPPDTKPPSFPPYFSISLTWYKIVFPIYKRQNTLSTKLCGICCR